eukprot:m.106690 g.106690  ORF g.106690 m.106690 type:complete len:274 (+) comp12715_c1_seq2:138-959(+)
MANFPAVPRTVACLRQLLSAGVTPTTIIQALSVWVPPERQETMAAVARRRLPGVTCVLEGLYDQGNIGAVARSAESLGVPNLGVVCLHGDRYKNKHTRRTGVGADKWVNFTKFESTEDCYRRLREEGTKIFVSSCDTPRALDTDTASTGYAGAGPGLATLPQGEAEISSTALHNVDWGVGPIAVVFGNEYLGLSEAAVTLADESFHIETHGFTQSLNVSVAAAIVLRELSIVRPLPSEDDQHAALAEMMLRTVLSKGVTADGIQSLCEQTSCQ